MITVEITKTKYDPPERAKELFLGDLDSSLVTERTSSPWS